MPLSGHLSTTRRSSMWTLTRLILHSRGELLSELCVIQILRVFSVLHLQSDKSVCFHRSWTESKVRFSQYQGRTL